MRHRRFFTVFFTVFLLKFIKNVLIFKGFLD